jgi:hypothetical protein
MSGKGFKKEVGLFLRYLFQQIEIEDRIKCGV